MEALLSVLGNFFTILGGVTKLFGRGQLAVQSPETTARILDEPLAVRPVSHASEVAQRLSQLIELLKQCYSDLTLAELAEYLGHDDVGVLEGLLRGDSPPKLSILEGVAKQLGASPDWLKAGKYTPFSNHAPAEHDPRNYVQHIQAAEPLSVYLIRSKCETGHVLIAFKLSRYNFKVFRTILHISRHVGATGQRQLYEFYEFIRELRDKYSYGRDLGTQVYGRTLSDAKFRSLVDGTVFPGTVIEKQSFNCSWWDDLTDINYGYAIARDGYAGYGHPFMEAQSVIRDQIRCRGGIAE
ncbi:helix-turn-helix transcriptional regulator [Caenispirillum bisanense]|uniref:helix-turn-helix domain-containing protein n=1 Tax=Caenispirillum bisanense TaxID=414052 RepID=UPI0031D5EBD5